MSAEETAAIVARLAEMERKADILIASITETTRIAAGLASD
jgi:hypothetical protein